MIFSGNRNIQFLAIEGQPTSNEVFELVKRVRYKQAGEGRNLNGQNYYFESLTLQDLLIKNGN